MSSAAASAHPALLLGYDTERHRSSADIAEELEGLVAIVAVHEELGVPATFFVLGRLIEVCHAGTLRALIGRPWAEVQSHTYSHPLLRRHPTRGDGITAAELRIELQRTADLLEREFGTRPTGLRAPIGFFGGLQGETEKLDVIAEAGLGYLSSDLKGPGDALPAPWLDDAGRVRQPYRYPNGVWEIPTQGWHDCRLKGLTGPEAQRAELRERWSVELETAEWIRDLEYAAAHRLCFAACFHPFAVAQDGGRVLRALIGRARELGVQVLSYGDYAHRALGPGG